MLRNYLTVAIRNLYRHRAFSLINVTGLAVGMACCVLIFLYVDHEFRYDRHHEKAGQIYRIIREFRQSGSGSVLDGGASGALTAALPKELPGIEQAVRLYIWGGAWVRHGDREFAQTICVADPAILEVCTLPLVRGDRSTALRDHSSVLITEEMALKLFPGEDPLGQLILVDVYLCSGEYRGGWRATGRGW